MSITEYLPDAVRSWGRQLASLFQPQPEAHRIKTEAIRAYAKNYGLNQFIETGTYLGDTVEAVRRLFEKIISIEIEPTLFRRAVERFAANPSVRIIQGDSAAVLPDIVKELQSPSLFWLDGHYSAGITGRGQKETPILEELTAVAKSAVPGHVLLIDDARMFNGTHDYPTLSELRQFARRLWPSCTFEVKDDIVRICP